MDTDPTPEVSALLTALDDAPATETTEHEPGEVEGQEDEQAEGSEESEQPEATEDPNPSNVIEFDGKRWELPPGTPPEVAAGVKKMADDLKADYTRKRQAAAAEEQQVKQHAQTISELRQIMAATEEVRSQRVLIASQLQQLKAIDWDALAHADPGRAVALQAQQQRLIEAQQQAEGQAQQLAFAERQRMQAAKQEAMARVIEDAPKIIPGFNQRINVELMETLIDCGFDADQARDSMTSPQLLKLVNFARVGRSFLAAKPGAMKKAAQAPQVIKTQAPAPKKQNASALDRLKKNGRGEDLMAFL